MRKTLYLKFVLAYILFGIFGFIMVASVISNMDLDHEKQVQADALLTEATTIANTYAADLYNSEASIDSVYTQLGALSSYNNARILILNPSGRMVVDSAKEFDPDVAVTGDGFDPADFSGSPYLEGTFYDTFDEDQICVLAPIASNYRTVGYVIMCYPMSLVVASTQQVLQISYVELLILLLLSVIILIFFTEIVYVPLRKITKATEQYAAGNMHYTFTVDSEDEMGYLAASLNYMAGEIAGKEDDQKKFIANVSHDFRSPLTSIHGFLEAMLDGTIPPELNGKYLKVCLNETDRLTKLTNDLLTLNNLNTRGMILNKTDFDLNEMIRQVAASFEHQCHTKKITLSLVLTGKELYVNADAGRIQQVLYNLVDNAIKFSHPDSTVKVETTERGHKVFTSVKDTGIGIPKEDQKLIFDRFYKTDLSRGKDKMGTGLGLSIVREILRAHGENINVVSTEGVGSEFIFTLERSNYNDALDENGSSHEETE